MLIYVMIGLIFVVVLGMAAGFRAVMGAISDLTGQSYVDVYGFRVKHGNLKGKDVSKFVKPRPGGKPLPPPRVAKA